MNVFPLEKSGYMLKLKSLFLFYLQKIINFCSCLYYLEFGTLNGKIKVNKRCNLKSRSPGMSKLQISQVIVVLGTKSKHELEKLSIFKFQKTRIMWHLRFSFSSTGYYSTFTFSLQWFSLKNMVLYSFLRKMSIIVIRENSVRIHLNLWTLHIGQTEFPAGI